MIGNIYEVIVDKPTMSSPEFQTSEAGLRWGDLELVWAQNSRDFFFSNSIVLHGDPMIVVDPSANFTYFERLSKTPVTQYVLNTHYHSDHRALNSLFKKATFMCHAAEAKAMTDWESFLAHLDSNQDSPYLNWVQQLWTQMNIRVTPPTQLLQDGDWIEGEHLKMQAVHLPGHTPGMIGLLIPEANLFFTADIDLTPFGPWYGNTVSSISNFKTSVAKARAIETEYYVTSHGQRLFTRDEYLKKIDRFAQYFEKREEAIITALQSSPQTIDQLTEAGIIYRKALLGDPLHYYFSNKMIEKHLEGFISAGLVVADGTEYHWVG